VTLDLQDVPMRRTDEARVGLMVVRVWAEGRQGDQLRVRIVRTVDVQSSERVVAAASTAEEVCDEVRAWLADFST
jgi:hypothetical protein